MWRCGVCGYIHEGDEAPDKCPKCGAPKEKFAKIENDAAEVIQRSRYTNLLHMTLASLLTDMADIAEDGIEDNLDPNCVRIFVQAKEFSRMLTSSIHAELAGHMKKGKWG
jgi:rubredoxin